MRYDRFLMSTTTYKNKRMSPRVISIFLTIIEIDHSHDMSLYSYNLTTLKPLPSSSTRTSVNTHGCGLLF